MFPPRLGQAFQLQTEEHETGSLTVYEPQQLGLFDIKRVYYLHSLRPGALRGAHAHKKLEQLIVAINGRFTLSLERFGEKLDIAMENPQIGYYVPPLTWRNLSEFSDGAVCMVLASQEYEEDDYIRDYGLFLEASRQS
jgi:dTDP-4-dehydrorhamnose 3,5-epimerase-like enzyme